MLDQVHAGAFADPDATRLRYEAAAAAALRFRAMGLSTADARGGSSSGRGSSGAAELADHGEPARRGPQVPGPPLPPPAAFAPNFAPPGSPPKPDDVERALRELVAALCADGRGGFAPDMAPALHGAPTRVKRWFDTYDAAGPYVKRANRDWFELCCDLGGDVEYRVNRGGAEYQLRASRSNFLVALAKLVGAPSAGALVTSFAKPHGHANRLDVEASGTDKVRCRVVAATGDVLCQVSVRPGKATIERSLCRRVDDFAEAARTPPWARALHVGDGRAAEALADAWRKPDASWPLLLAASPPSVLGLVCDGALKGQSVDEDLLDAALLASAARAAARLPFNFNVRTRSTVPEKGVHALGSLRER